MNGPLKIGGGDVSCPPSGRTAAQHSGFFIRSPSNDKRST